MATKKTKPNFMYDVLFHYQRVHPTTWMYLSSLLMIGLFFKFNRLWSVRNLDLVLFMLLAPGLLLAYFGKQFQDSVLSDLQQETAALVETDDPDAQLVPWPQRPLDAEDDAEDSVMVEPANDSEDAAATEDTEDPAGPAPSAGEGEEDIGDELAAEETAVEAEAAAEDEELTKLEKARRMELLGYVWLMMACGVWLVRLLMDATMVRRPLLEPNLSSGGLAFIGCAMFIFLMANVVAATPAESYLAEQQEMAVAADGESDVTSRGPGYSLLFVIPTLTTQTLYSPPAGSTQEEQVVAEEVMAARIMAILSHLAIVVGMVLIGYRHFNNVRMGLGAAMIYLMLPYTAMMTGHNDHSLPAALLVWAVFTYRRPLLAGILLGLAAGVVYYPFFLLPLWISFYWKRGLGRFLAGVGVALGAMVLTLLVSPHESISFVEMLQQMFGVWKPVTEGLLGIWNDQNGGLDPNYRLPVLAAFVVLSISFALWPAQKNLGTLLSCSAALMVASQFWHGFGGGTFLAWFLPMAILTVFRPNLEDRVALSVLSETWLTRRRTQVRALDDDAERAA